MRVHATTLPDGRLGIIRVNPNAPDQTRALSKTLFELQRASIGIGPDVHYDPSTHDPLVTLAARTMDDSALPVDHYFRNAWTDTIAAISVDMSKARTIHMACIRDARDAELKVQDANMMRFLESRNITEQDRIAAIKQQLRDIPQTFDLSGASTPDTLKALWPTELPARS